MRMRTQQLVQKLVRAARGEVSTTTLVARGLRVGKNFNRQGGCIIDPPHCWLIAIGDDVTLASRVYILAHDASTKAHLGYAKIGVVRIGNRVFVGANSTILPNVSIGDDVVIGAGSLVTSDIPSNSVAVGNPARVVSSTSDYVEKNRELLASRPTYGESWTLRGGISNAEKTQMFETLKGGIGFVV